MVILAVTLVVLAVKHYPLRQSMSGRYDISLVSSSSTKDTRKSARTVVFGRGHRQL